jgi:catabolite regulation protein CreA
MAIAVITMGTVTMQAAEMALGTVSTGKTVVCQLDLNAMAAGDVAEVRCYVKTAGPSGTLREYFAQVFADAQSGAPVYQSIPVPAPYEVAWRVIQPTGTGRAVPYALFTLD